MINTDDVLDKQLLESLLSVDGMSICQSGVAGIKRQGNKLVVWLDYGLHGGQYWSEVFGEDDHNHAMDLYLAERKRFLLQESEQDADK